MLRLLQPVESSWEKLADNLLRNELQYKVDTINTDCFHDDASKNALDDVCRKWLKYTKRVNRTWQTLSDTAKNYKDETLEKFIQENDDLQSKFQYVNGSMKGNALIGTIKDHLY